MRRGWEIRNRYIEDQHPTEISGEVITRKMTAEDWAKYGPRSDKKRRPIINIYKPKPKEKEDPKIMKSKIDLPTIILMAKKHTLSQEGREKIAEELGVSRVDVTNFVCRPNVKKALRSEKLWTTIGHTYARQSESVAAKLLEPASAQVDKEPVISSETPAPSSKDFTSESDTALDNEEVSTARDQIMNTFSKRQGLFNEITKRTVEKNDINILGAYISKMRDRIFLVDNNFIDPVDTVYLREIFIAIGCAAVTGLAILNRE